MTEITSFYTVEGGCHCGAVRYAVQLGDPARAQICNCSICTMTGYVHLIVPATRFTLLRGAEALVSYRFNTGTADHLFCGTCGIKSYYVPRSNPDGISVNLNCVDRTQLKTIETEAFDGADWERQGHSLARLSQAD